MKVSIKNKQAIFPMPVLLIATYNEDGSVDVMNAAWGTMLDVDKVALNLTETHKTVENIKRNKAFTVAIADAKHVVEADFFGVVSGNNDKEKFKKSGLTAIKSENLNAPIIDEFPITLECSFIEFQNEATGIGVIGQVKNVLVDEKVMEDGKINIDKVDAIAFDPFTAGYYRVSGRVGNAFKDGFKLK